MYSMLTRDKKKIKKQTYITLIIINSNVFKVKEKYMGGTPLCEALRIVRP